MLAPFKPLVAILCIFSTIVLYSLDHSPSPAQKVRLRHGGISDTTSLYSYDNDAATSNRSSASTPDRSSKILQATMMFGHNYKGVNERTLQSHAKHARIWGYGDHVLTREIVGAGEVEGEGEWNKYIFSKILYILRIMIAELEKPREERAEWIVWYDADTLILNPNIQWEIFLPPSDDEIFSDIKFLATKDVSGFNAGVFFCRIDEWVIDVLTDAYALPRLYPEVDIAGNIEQNAMKWIFSQEENKKHVVYQPRLWYNWFSTTVRSDKDVKGDMLIHFSGINHDYEGQMKKGVMEAWFSKLTDPAAWSVPLDKTKYPKEIPAFWKNLRAARVLLSFVGDRSGTNLLENEHSIQLARNELKWAAEEEAHDVEKMNVTIRGVLEALRISGRSEDQALLKAFEEEQATEILVQGLSDAATQVKAFEAMPLSKSPAGDVQSPDESTASRFGHASSGSQLDLVMYG